jgi:PAS domain S-box-containing protein
VRRIWRESWYPLRDPAGAVVGINVVAEEITAERRAAAALRESEQRFRTLADNVPVMIWVTDAGGRCQFVNQGWQDFTGQRGDEGLGLGWLDAVHPDDRVEAERVFRRATARGEAFRLDYRLRRHDGVYRWCIDMGKPRPDGDGRFAGFAGTVIDISERKETEERQTLMMRELDHRTKNMLAAVQAVMRLTKAPDMTSFVETVEGRVQALATAHALIARHRWQGVGLRTLLTEQLAPYRGDRVRIEGPDIVATPSAAQALAMIIHELATNAAKYGALSRETGRIHVHLQPAARGCIRLIWREQGGPAAAPPSRRGLGSDIIRSSAQAQLDGRVDYDWRPEGLTLHLTIGPGALHDGP